MTEVNWRRVLVISALLTALLLVCGSIYLHIQQKHHLGRLYHKHPVVPYGAVEAANVMALNNSLDELTLAKEYNYDDEDYNSSRDEIAPDLYHSLFRVLGNLTQGLASDEEESDKSAAHTMQESTEELDAPSVPRPLVFTEVNYLAESCLQCICETISNCEPSMCGANVPCGLFRISRPYWIDGGKQKVPNTSGNQATVDDYQECVNNDQCALRTVNAFVRKFRRDCNADGVIDCQDHVMLHVLGPTGCQRQTLMPVFAERVDACFARLKLKRPSSR